MDSNSKEGSDVLEATTSNRSDGDHEVDDWSEKQIGFLTARILSSVKARKETTGAEGFRSSGQHAQPVREDGRKTASNLKRGGGAVPGVQGSEKTTPSRRQQPPDNQTKRRDPKDRSVTYSGDL